MGAALELVSDHKQGKGGETRVAAGDQDSRFVET
jgi:hypothetical protein